MLKNLLLINAIFAVANCKTLLVPIDYEYTLDVYYNFKNHPDIVVNPVSEGLQVYIPDSTNSTYYRKRANVDCDELSEGMIVLNIDKASDNTLITWDQYDVFHLIDPATGEELEYDSVIQEDCSSDLSTTTLSASSSTSTTDSSLIDSASLVTDTTSTYEYALGYSSGVETYIGTVKSGNPTNYTTYIPLNSYGNNTSTQTILSTNSEGSVSTYVTTIDPSLTTTKTYGFSDTLALLAPARLTTTTVTQFVSGSTYTISSTVTSCKQHAMGGCVVETLSSVFVAESDGTSIPVSTKTFAFSSSSSVSTSSADTLVVSLAESSLITVSDTTTTSSSSSTTIKTVASSTFASSTSTSSSSAPSIVTSYSAAAVGQSIKEKSFFIILLTVLISNIKM
ncbi:hypothetical protein HANVADRAFT_3571 [Hanseniaspora valbyensis NRRL Y-1626]|uniref:Uncharacterized protein n=1 Tax=Hanseniaspora valbyensis NRRL Y-1626 TaxID=766949 RepID=A0A1B7TA90_9ASCO|nr:hypothetical protein HANVADRAFT_3571 [Hanseniaspora valbyensis NRRL Y-1626]